MIFDIKLSIVIPTLNRADLLQELLLVLLQQSDNFEHLLIIDNGNQNLMVKHPKISVYTPGRNLGVAASWNFGIDKLFENNDITHVLALNDDIILGNEQLLVIKRIIRQNPNYWFYVGNYYWSVWAISRHCCEIMLNTYGYVFDSIFWPAYCEDNDFHYRLGMLNNNKYFGSIEDFVPNVCRNSMTSKANPVINHKRSLQVYKRKWGGTPGNEKFIVPFDGKLL